MSSNVQDGSSAGVHFSYYEPLKLIVCRMCNVAVPASTVREHLGTVDIHKQLLATTAAKKACWLDTKLLWPDAIANSAQISAATVPAPIPHLKVYKCFGCTASPDSCSHVVRMDDRRQKAIRTHLSKVHGIVIGLSGGTINHERRMYELQLWRDHTRIMYCQRLGRAPAGGKIIYAEILNHVEAETVIPQPTSRTSSTAYLHEVAPARALLPAPNLTARIASELDSLDAAHDNDDVAGTEGTLSNREANPWLEMTRWPTFLAGQSLREAASLLYAPPKDRLVALLGKSLERLVYRARDAIIQDRLNPFDQVRINSFLPRPTIRDRPIMVRMLSSTWKNYIAVWRALLCFVYRTRWLTTDLVFSHRLTAEQQRSLTLLMSVADTRLDAADEAADTDDLDEACLELCMTLLQHELKGELFDSAVVGFFAVLGIQPQQGVFKEAARYSSYLSAFIKISQLLVVARALDLVDSGEQEHHSDFLDMMRHKYMGLGASAPFTWAVRMRTFAKRISENNTSLGYIEWSEDEESLSYKQVRDMAISSFKAFVQDQVRKSQAELAELLLPHPSEAAEDLRLRLPLHKLADAQAERTRGYNFLQHPANLAGCLPIRSRFLMERVLENDWLSDEYFMRDEASGTKNWNHETVASYTERVDVFMERLLLLVHLTGGQPARGTELLSLRYANTLHGGHRSIFVDRGMVSSVTSYHKGYNVTNSIRIIHRFLPEQVGIILVYYLWIVQPFRQQLDALVLQKGQRPSYLLWPSAQDNTICWSTSKMSQILNREFQAGLGLTMNVQIYRHIAIAISRKHLRGHGFRKDFDIGNNPSDEQAGHSSAIAARVYARGLEEGLGHIAERKEAFRAVSKAWHKFLGLDSAGAGSLKAIQVETEQEPSGESESDMEFEGFGSDGNESESGHEQRVGVNVESEPDSATFLTGNTSGSGSDDAASDISQSPTDQEASIHTFRNIMNPRRKRMRQVVTSSSSSSCSESGDETTKHVEGARAFASLGESKVSLRGGSGKIAQRKTTSKSTHLLSSNSSRSGAQPVESSVNEYPLGERHSEESDRIDLLGCWGESD